MKNFVYFVGWLLKRMFGGVIGKYHKYDEFVVEEPGIAIFPTLLISLGVMLVTLVTCITVDYINMSALHLSFFAGSLVYVNYFRILLREQYRKFNQEQDKMLDTLKGKRG
jgi:hypothetical protein